MKLETPESLIRNTARLHGRNDLFGMLARDLVRAMDALQRLSERYKHCRHGSVECFCTREALEAEPEWVRGGEGKQ